MKMKLLLLLLLYFCGNTDGIRYTRTVLKALERYIDEILNSASIETECAEQLKMYLADVRNPAGNIWALQMLDASGKSQPGILKGNVLITGNYDECLEIDVNRNGTQIKGQYCRVVLTPSQTVNECIDRKFSEMNVVGLGKTPIAALKPFFTFTLDVCVPSGCSAENLQKLWNFTENRFDHKFHLFFDDDVCKTIEKEQYYSPVDITIIAIFGVIGTVVLLSTTYDILIFQKRKDKDKKYDFFMAFSFYTNGKKLFSTKETDYNRISCLNGLRVISLIWIILGHRYLIFVFLGVTLNSVEVVKLLQHEKSMFLVGAFSSVDTFFVISGFLIAYLTLFAKEMGIKINLLMFYVHRFLRLSPALVAMVLLHVGIATHLGSGPYWDLVESFIKKRCVKNWWSTVFYLENYTNLFEPCMIQTWYISVDTQLYFLSPLLFIPLQRWPKITIALILCLIKVSIGCGIYTVYYYEIDGIFVEGFGNIFSYLYKPTHLRMGPWLVGILLGYFMFKSRNDKIVIKKSYVLLLWTASLAIMLAVMYCSISFMIYKFTILEAALYAGLSRILWALCISWIMFACSRGFGGHINKFLSLSVFRVLARLTFSIYITHFSIVFLIHAQKRTPDYLDHLAHFHDVWGDYAFTLAFSVIWTLTFESPVKVLEKVFFKRVAKETNVDKTIKTEEVHDSVSNS